MTYEDDHGGGERVDDGASPIPRVLAVLVEADEHGEGDDEVERVESEADLVHAVKISEGVVREGFDGFGLKECPKDGDDDDGRGVESKAQDVVQVLETTANQAQDHVGKDVVGMEIGLGQKEADNGNLVELGPGDGEGVLGSKKREEVVSPEVVANKVEGTHPQVGLESVTTIPNLLALSGGDEDHGEDDARNEDEETDGVVAKIADTLEGAKQETRIKRRRGQKTTGALLGLQFHFVTLKMAEKG